MKKNSEVLKTALAIIIIAVIAPVFAFYAKVQTPGGTPIAGVAVTFLRIDTTAYSDDNGIVSFSHASAINPVGKATMPASLRISNRNIFVFLPAKGNVVLHLYTLSGRQVFATNGGFSSGLHTMHLPILATGIYILRAIVAGNSFVRKVNSTSVCQWQEGLRGVNALGKLSKRTMAIGDTAFFAKTGYVTVYRLFATYGDNLGSVFMDSSVNPVRVKTVSTGNHHTIILKQDGTFWAIGDNSFGQLGLGDTVMRGVSAVSVGSLHTMILKQDGTLWATGFNYYGQLGTGDTNTRKTPIQVMDGVSAVSAGFYHTMILKQDGTLWAAGNNDAGQLGDGTRINKYTPIQVMSGVLEVSAGFDHTMILKQDSTLWATGFAYYGQLGDGGAANIIYTPKQVMNGVSAVFSGYYHTMILKQDGTLWATGRDTCGQLGIGDTLDRKTPVLVMSSVSAVSAGYLHTMILKQDNTLWATGLNVFGQLGDGTFTNKSTPIQVMSDVAAVSAGSFQTIILKKDGSVWATGDNSSRQLGLENSNSRISTPQLVLLPPYNGLTVSGGTGSGTYSAGARIAIAAFDSTSANKGFDHWGGPDSIYVSSHLSGITTFTMPKRPAMVKAIFGDLYVLNIDGGIGTGSYIPGNNILISAHDSTATFDHWGGPDSALVLNDTLKSTTFAMPSKDAYVKSIYR